MATRWYLPPSGGTPGITPTPSTEWDDTANFTRVVPATTKTNTAFSTQSFAYATATANLDSLFKQFVYPLIPGTAFTTSDTFKGRVLVAEGANASNLRSQAVIRVIASDGSTVRATLYAGDTTTGTSNPTSEWALTTLTNRQVPRGTTVTCAANYTAVTGDYLVIELGYRKHAAASTTGSMKWGDNNATDLAENETTTADNNSWFEWSGTEAPAYATGDTFVTTDTFSGTAGDLLNTYSSANWAANSGNATGSKISAAGRAYVEGSSGQYSVYLNTATPVSAEYDVTCTTYMASTGANNWGGVVARASGTLGGSTLTHYHAEIQGSFIVMRKCVNNTLTDIAFPGITGSVGRTDTIEFLVRDASKKLILNGVEVISTTDNAITATGKAGIIQRPIDETGTSSVGIHVDNFKAQDVATGGAAKSATDSQALSITDTAAADATSTAADTRALSITDTAVIAAAYTTSDTRALTATDTATFAYPLSAGADTATLTITDSATVAVAKQADDAQALTATDTAAADATSTAADTRVLSVTDSVTFTYPLSAGADSATLSIADAATVAVPKQADDTATLSITDTAVIAAASTNTDTRALSVADTAAMSAAYTDADTRALSVADTAVIAASYTDADTRVLSVADTAVIAAAYTNADTRVLIIVDTASLASFAPKTLAQAHISG